MDYSSYFTAQAASAVQAKAAPESTGEIPKEEAGMFGADGASFRDVLDAVNPLNHIPIVSNILEGETGHKISTASKMIGGALLGGPIGFLASIANAVFEEATGKDAVGAVFAALTGGGEEEVQVASAATAKSTEAADATFTLAPIDAVEVAEQAKAVVAQAKTKLEKPVQVASLGGSLSRDEALLALYGNSAPSAHNSYKKAQMLPYLRDVTTSRVL